jgi:tetratricopeptide (TPR) repeat protein
MPLSAADRLGRYEILEPLGAGGMGEVYRAKDTELEREVAIKVLPEDMASDPDRLARFEREAKALAALNHPNIVTIHGIEHVDVTGPDVAAGFTPAGHPPTDSSAAGDKPPPYEPLHFIVMELVEGNTLSDLIPDAGLSLDRFFDISIPIADALSAAHGRGVTHRDLKPANVMVTEEGRVKVLDFGLAKMAEPGDAAKESSLQTITADGRVIGTVPYMSPEQVQGREADHRSDIFSLGVVMFEMAAGRRPFRGPTSADVISSILRDTPSSVTDVRTELPTHLGRIIRHCLDKDIGRRYQSALDIRNELEDLKVEVDSGEAVPDSAAAPQAMEPPVVYRTSMVGRANELAVLVAARDRAESGQGSLVMISGEPGVGKTRLAWDLVQRAREKDFTPLVGHCSEMEGAPPFLPWVEILEFAVRTARRRENLRRLMGEAAPELAKITPRLRRMYPDLPAPLDLPPEEGRLYMFNCVLEFLQRSCRQQPLLLILEDLHSADESTLALLRHLAPHLPAMAILVVGTFREVELDVSRPLAATLRELVRGRQVERVALARLPEAEVAAMLEGLSGLEPPQGLVQAIFTETEGNPFFVEEVYHHLEETGRLFDDEGGWREPLSLDELEVPESVRLVVGRRLERLSEVGQRVLTTAAVIGRRFSFELLEALEDVESESLLETVEEAEQLHLIHASGTTDRQAGFLFTHELIRQTMVSGLSLPRRQRLHARVAEAIEQVHGPQVQEHASDLANHLYQAGAAADSEKTVRYLTLAGDQAMEASGFEVALRHFDNALALLEDGDTGPRADLLWKKGFALRKVGRPEEALSNWQEALDIYEHMGDAARMVSASIDLAHLVGWLGRYREEAEIELDVLEAVGKEVTADRCRLLAAAGAALSWAGDHARGEDLLTEARAGAERLNDRPMLGSVLNREADMLVSQMRFREAVESGRRAVEELRAAGDLWLLAEALGYTGLSLVWSGRLDEARKVGEELEPLAIRLGNQGAQLFAGMSRGFSDLNRTADLDAFEALSGAGIETWQRAGPWSVFGYLFLGLAHLWRGRWEEAQKILQDGIRLEPPENHAGHFWGCLLLAKACAGDPDTRSLFDTKRADLPRPGQTAAHGAWHLLLLAVQAMATLGERDEAANLYHLVIEAIDTGTVLMGCVNLLQRCAGIAAAAGGQWDAAEQHFETALRQAHEIPVRIEQPEVRRWYAWMLLDRDSPGDRDKARTLLEEAIEAYTEIGMPKHVEMAEALLAKAKG